MNLIVRAKNILLTPKTEWPVIDAETGEIGFLFKNYVAILSAFHAICAVIGTTMLPFPTARLLPISIGIALVGFILSFVITWLFAHVINLLAPYFGARPDFPSALKLSVYSQTPFWLSAVFYLVPVLSVLAFLGLYTFYLLWLGLPVLMKSLAEKTLPYVLAAAVCGLVIYVLSGLAAGALVHAVLGPLRPI